MSKRKVNKYVCLEAESDSEEESEDLDTPTLRFPTSNYSEMARRIEQKYADLEVYDEEEEEEEDFDEDASVSQANFLPKKSSPRLFLVRVKRGKEKEIVLRILQNNPKICSIIAKDGLKGYIYIEAFQKQQVLDSFDRVRGINKNKISVVPYNEMIEALTYRNEYKNVEFGRLKKGKYKGDLVRVIDNDGDMIKIRVMPRINNIKKLFDPEEYKDEVIKDGEDRFIYKRDLYVQGYLEKEILKSSIDLDVEPNFEELEQFNIRKIFDSGDKVQVIKGELIGLKGIIKSVTGQMSVIESEKKFYEIFSNFLEKFYEIGEEVCFGNENGIITNIKDRKYFVALKNFTEEVETSIDFLKKPIPFTKEVIRKDKIRPVIKRDNLVNKQVQISKGQYKGYIGIVKDSYMNKCRVQIISNLKFVTVPKEDLVETNVNIEIERNTKKTFSSIVTKTPAYEPDLLHFNIERSIDRFDGSDETFKGALINHKGDEFIIECLSGNKYLTNNGVFDKSSVRFVVPGKEDTVVVMQGEDIGKSAILLEIDEYTKNCVIKIVNGNIKNVPLGILTKKSVI
ncbi:transcription elongation factor SPT5 [Vairimorpha necatrix]|uniref:Chromatin elongation factor SPT5 n=1 Tax=Vairimorpha necatrix TaxID=6039 RepID=A0AAX4J8B1_9MICR